LKVFSPAYKVASGLLLYGIGVPVVRVLDVLGGWPRIIAAGARRATVDSFGEYQPTTADVFVCAGFKAGTTWALQIGTQIAFRGAAEFSNIHDVVPWPDAPPLARTRIIPLGDASPARRSPTGLRVIKTHLPLESVPFSPAARYVAVVRDPKGAIVSGYHHMKSMLFGPLMPSVEHWIDLNLSGSAGHGSWARHLASYWRERHRDNVLFLTYESLKRDLPAGVRKIAQFMRVELTAAELAAVVQASCWEGMKRAQDKFDPGKVLPWSGSHYFLRRGQSGASSELLTAAMQSRIDEACRAELTSLGCDFPYDVEFAPPASR